MSDDVAAKWQAQQNMAMGALGYGGPQPMTEEEHRRQQREAELQQAVYILDQASKIRADAALMAEVRSHIRKLRDAAAALLDELWKKDKD